MQALRTSDGPKAYMEGDTGLIPEWVDSSIDIKAVTWQNH